jgi:hypothetical protein
MTVSLALHGYVRNNVPLIRPILFRQSAPKVYAGQLDLPEAIIQGAQLVELSKERPTALLCFERNPEGCHRSLLIDAIMSDAERIDL